MSIDDAGEPRVVRLSELRSDPCLVLLGEPGIGKSSALEKEARDEGGRRLTCREVINGGFVDGTTTAYLDALDEYRTTGDGKDKIQRLATMLASSGIVRWRLTCRAEDWRSVADQTVMASASSGMAVRVATLLPLDDDEVVAILSTLGEVDPASFVEQARRRGAEGFLRSPLSLRLLAAAVTGAGEWPGTRFDLFQQATEKLSHEWDPAREHDPLPPPSDVLATAGTLFLYMLGSWAAGLWRSNAAPPDGTTLVPVNGLPIDRGLAEATLDTALFRAEGNVFQPMHRVVAEFLAAGALARAIGGGGELAAFPLDRALALFSAPDLKSPSELRGLFGWLAAHLAHRGDDVGAKRMIDRDAVTVLAYGDPAVLSTDARRMLLRRLGADDPFFASTLRDGSTVLGGLAGDDLVPDFREILVDGSPNTDLLQTVYNALLDGPRLPDLLGVLEEVAFSTRPLWQRWRATELLARYDERPAEARLRILHRLSEMAVDPDQLSLRGRMMAELPAELLSVDEIRAFLADFASSPKPDREEGEHSTTDLYRLGSRLKREPRPELFDEPVIPDLKGLKDIQGYTYGLRSIVGEALAAAISSTPDLGARRLVQWLVNARQQRWGETEGKVGKAVASWLDGGDGSRSAELFGVMLEGDRPDENPWMVDVRYTMLSGRGPDDAIFDSVLQLANDTAEARQRRRLLAIAAHMVHSRGVRPEAHWRMLDALRATPGTKSLIALVESVDIGRRRIRTNLQRAQEKVREAELKARSIEELAPDVARISSGDQAEFGVLHWAALHYFDGLGEEPPDPLGGIERYGDAYSAAMLAEGLVRFAASGRLDIGIEDLGGAEARSTTYNVEVVLAAGVHRAASTGRTDELGAAPLTVAVACLRQHWRDGGPLRAWALDRLARDIGAGTEALLSYWETALDQGDRKLDGIHLLFDGHPELAVEVCTRILRDRPDMPEAALVSAIRLAVEHAFERLGQLAAAARSRLGPGEAADIWTFIALALDPALAGTIDHASLPAVLSGVDDELAKALQDRCPDPVPLDLLRVRVLGNRHAPDPRDYRKGNTASAEVRSAIKRIGAAFEPTAGEGLRELLDIEALSPWRWELEHALSEHLAIRRDREFRAPSVAEITSVLSGGPPVSPRDLQAVVMSELRRYQAALRTGQYMPWKTFWNTDQHGRVVNPRIENECRDRLFEHIGVLLQPYRIAGDLPEARRGENTRVDVLLLSHAGMNLPIELKRAHNVQLWDAASTQLSGYADDERAHGLGVYLVIWFGTGFKLPARGDGAPAPTTAQDLESILREDLPEGMRSRFEVVVLDASPSEDGH